METLSFFRTASPAGPLFLAASAKGLVRLEFEGRMMKLDPAIQLRESKHALAPYLRELDEYFAGERREFSLPLAAERTDFQREVWRGLAAIPYGVTLSYGQLALAIGRPRAVRAVGLANGRNPISIIVPCHRVIGANGTLTGYGGGMERKRFLLDLERGGELAL